MLAVFTHHSHGPAGAMQVLGGLLLGLLAPAVFFLVLALTLPAVGLPAFAIATAAAIAAQGTSMLAIPGTDTPPARVVGVVALVVLLTVVPFGDPGVSRAKEDALSSGARGARGSATPPSVASSGLPATVGPVSTPAASGHARVVTRTVLIVDDHPAVRRAARRMLEQDGFEVVAERGSAREALEAAVRLRPGIVVLDVALPDADGVEVARRLTEAGEAPAVVLTSSRSGADLGDAVMECGARGFIPKHELSGSAIAALAA